MRALFAAALYIASVTGAHGQQLGDLTVDLAVASPSFPEGVGPIIAVDEAHSNFHKIGGRFQPFAKLLSNDGYRISAFTEEFNADNLKAAHVLVIANSLHRVNVGNWRLPTPSAFTPAEIAAVKSWVGEGGALLLIADHIPFAGAASDLAAAFGFTFRNVYAQSRIPKSSDTFALADETLKDDPILHGRNSGEAVSKVVTFGGSAFTAPAEARPILVLPHDFELLFPSDANKVSPDTPREDGAGLLQGAVMTVGKGRIAVFGEAAMFSAQRLGPAAEPMGFNAPEAGGNRQFILNLVRWLAGAA